MLSLLICWYGRKVVSGKRRFYQTPTLKVSVVSASHIPSGTRIRAATFGFGWVDFGEIDRYRCIYVYYIYGICPAIPLT